MPETKTTLDHAVHSACYMSGFPLALCGLDVSSIEETHEIPTEPCVVCYAPGVTCLKCKEEIAHGASH